MSRGIVFSIGVIFWGLHFYLGHQHNHSHHTVDETIYFLIIGTILVLGTYYLNHRYLKCCPSHGCSQNH